MKVTTLGIDLAKSIFQLHGVNEHGKVTVQKRVTRGRLRETIAQLPPCMIGMEACGSAQYWAREFQELGHTVKLISPQFVKPYVKGNKNDSRDAEAICEAVSGPHMRFVPLKTVESQNIQAIDRMRSRLMKERTALVNQVRGLLAERGIVIAQGITRLRQHIRTETTKIESYNSFTDWIAFGGPVLRSGDPVEQEKRIKHRDLVANAVMLHNVVDMTNVLRELQQEGLHVTPKIVSRLSPYLTEHIKRFGLYVLHMLAQPEPLQPTPLFVTSR